MPRSKRKDTLHVHCPNTSCLATFTSTKGLSDHFLYFSQCAFYSKCVAVNITKSTSVPSNFENACDSEDDDMSEVCNTEVVSTTMEDENTDNSDTNAQDTPNNNNLLARKKRQVIHRTKDNFHPTKLLKILESANAPHFLYSDICQWAKEAKNDGYDFNPERTTREAQIAHLEKWQKLEYCRPYTIPIQFPEDNLQIDTTVFDFTHQLFSLFNDPKLTGSLDKLDVNTDNPFTKYKSPDGLVGTFNSGKWYDKAWDFHCRPGSNDWLCPIIFACDETLVGSHLGRASMTPLVFTLSIFNEHLRNQSIAWRPLGYIYDMNIHGKAMNTQTAKRVRKMNAEEKCARHHMILEAILRSFVQVQQEGGIKGVEIQLGHFRKKKVNIKVPVGMILGDMQGGDKHCGSVVGYSSNMARLCRQCNISGEESGNPLIECQKMSMVKIKKLVEDNNVAMLKKISQNNVYCAWFDVDFGGCPRGVFSAAMPVEALHAVEIGLCKDMLHILFENDLKDFRKRELDSIAKQMCDWDKQYYMTSGSNKDMPRLLFKDGISSLKQISATYTVGIFLCVVILTLTDDGKAFFEAAFKAEYGKKTPGSKFADERDARKRLSDMRYVFSMMLCYWSWLKKKTYWKCGDTDSRKRAENAIQIMLTDLIRLWPRAEGNGWFKPKVHEQKHVPKDIEQNGSPRNSNGGPIEHHQLDVKKRALRTQMIRTKLDEQVATRAAEGYIIDYAYERMVTTEDNLENANDDDSVTSYSGKSPKSSHGTIIITSGEKRKMKYSFAYSKSTPIDTPFDADVLQFIADSFSYDFCNKTVPLESLSLELFTDYKRNDIIFRAHPHYRNRGRGSYDWVMFRFAKSDHDICHNKTYRLKNYPDEVFHGDDATIAGQYHYAPGQLKAFVHMPDDGIKAVVKCCSFEHTQSSVISTYWKIEYLDKANTKPYYALLDVDAIVRHCLMIPENNDNSAYHEIWTKDRWAKEFM